MSTVNVREELGIMHDKLTHYGQFVWMNIVLTSWERAYKDAYSSVAEKWGRYKIDTTIDLILLGVLIGTQPWTIQMALGPMLFGLSKVMDSPKTIPESVAATPDTFISDQKLHFGRLLAVCSQSIIELYDKKIEPDEFLAFRSRTLLSPIWYPPRSPNIDELTKKIKRRLWAKLLLELKSGQVFYDIKTHVKEVRLSSDEPTEVDLIKYQKLLTDYVVYKGRGKNNADTRELWGPVFYELSRPDPLSYPLPMRVQNLVDRIDLLVSGMTGAGYVKPTASHISNATEIAMSEIPKTLRLDWTQIPSR